MRLTARWALVAALMLGGSWRHQAQAHEPGVTRVDLEIAPTGHVVATVPADPAAVWRASVLAAGVLPGDTPEPEALTARGAQLAADLAGLVALTADGVRVPLAVTAHEWTAARADAPVGSRRLVARLEGRLPPGASSVVWRYSLPVGGYPLRVREDGRAEPRVVWVLGDQASVPLRLADTGALGTIRQYTWLGLVHIVPRGLDHILFVLSLFLLSRAWRPLLVQVSAFTVAHSLTLGAAMAGLVTAPAWLVEPLIAASIAWVALENLWRSSLSRTRVGVVFAFGLLHGAGFAGVLTELGLPQGARLLALLSFNVGVELGQLLVLAAAFAATAVLLHQPRTYRRWVVVPASLGIAAVGVYWTVTRALAGSG